MCMLAEWNTSFPSWLRGWHRGPPRLLFEGSAVAIRLQARPSRPCLSSLSLFFSDEMQVQECALSRTQCVAVCTDGRLLCWRLARQRAGGRGAEDSGE
jgi:hypothetical protein